MCVCVCVCCVCGGGALHCAGLFVVKTAELRGAGGCVWATPGGPGTTFGDFGRVGGSWTVLDVFFGTVRGRGSTLFLEPYIFSA